MKRVLRTSDNFITVSSNITSTEYVTYLKELNIGGMEFIATIPGTIGGLVAMNAGCYKQEISDFFYKGVFLDRKGNLQIMSKKELEFKYRSSLVKTSHLICLCVLFEASDKPFDNEKLKRLKAHRRETQPAGNSAGSVFVNPSIDTSAWKLIDDVGLRGHRIGGVVVSDKHSNFIINDKKGNAADIYSLIKLIQEKVKTHHGIELHTELEMLNF